MPFHLATLARRVRNPRRRSVTLRDIVPPAVLATDLYQAAYAPVIALWSRAGDRIAAEYERTLSALTTDTADDLRSILDDAAAEFQRLFLLLRPALERWTIGVERWQRSRWRGAVLAATSVDLDTIIGPEDVRETLSTRINANVDLIADISAQARQRISNTVFNGLTARAPAREVAAQIRENVAMSKRRATAVASDQLSKLTGSLAEERQRQAGIEKVEWKSSHKLHPRKWHAARDGKLFDLDTKKALDGSEIVEPGDWVSQAPYCGCRTLAHITFD